MSYDYLTEQFPETVFVEGKETKVKTSFRNILNILSLFKDGLFTETEKQILSLSMFYEEIPNNGPEAIHEMMRFIRCYADNEKKEEGREETFDFEIDSSSIYSAFFQVYGIDLSELDIHWFQFISMFENLNDGTPNLVNIMNIRQMKIDPSLPSDKKNEIRKLKRMYSLTSEKHSFSKSSELANVLMKETK